MAGDRSITRRSFLKVGSLAGAAACVEVSGAGCMPPSPGPTSSPSLDMPAGEAEETSLPPPRLDGEISLERCLAQRRSVREFSAQELTLPQISQLLWAAQGTSHPAGLRTSPSAGALYPLELYIVSGAGLHHYRPTEHRLVAQGSEDLRARLCQAALNQASVRDAPVVFVVAAVHARTESRYGAQRTPRYVHMEAGHAAQNLLLQAVALGLAGVPIGAFHDEDVQTILSLPPDHLPLYLIPIGHPR